MKQKISIDVFKVERFPVQVRAARAGPIPKDKIQKHLGLGSVYIIAIVPLLVSCASAPVTLAPVGPGPYALVASQRGMGKLQVYSQPEEYYDEDLPYFPHTDYQLFTVDGTHLRRVWNHTTHEDETPVVVSLRPGKYLVQAWAEFQGVVRVPVVIKANKLTKVILQPGWNPGNHVTRTNLVQIPKGYFVGWRAD